MAKLRLTWEEFVELAMQGLREVNPQATGEPEFRHDYGAYERESEHYDFPDAVEVELADWGSMNQQIKTEPAKLTTHRLLHVLWTKAVGTDDYDKAEWRELSVRLGRAGLLDAADLGSKEAGCTCE